MIADHGAAAQRGETDIAGAPCPGDAVAAAYRAVAEIDAARRD
jgi:hypothetical protein